MVLSIYHPVYYVAALYLLAVFIASMYNFWRAPPPAGHRPLLIASIVLFGIGVLVDGGGKVGLIPDVFEIIADPVQLLSIAILFHVTRNIRLAIASREHVYGVAAVPLLILMTAAAPSTSAGYYLHLVIEIALVALAVTVAAMWFDINRTTSAARNLPFAVLLLAIALASHGLEEFGVAVAWSQSIMVVSSVAAASFWLDASFDIADGRL